MRKSILTAVFVAMCPLLFAQQALNNGAVIKLVKAGLSDDLIVSTISAQQGSYDASADGLIALKAAGVSDKVVSAILAKAAAPAPVAAARAALPASVAVDPDDPASPHDPGLYLMATAPDGKRKMVFVDRGGAGGEKTHWAKLTAEIPGPRAVIRTDDANPVFYMYFPSTNNQAGLGGQDVISSPSQFELVSLEIKKDRRETAVFKSGFNSVSFGVDEKRAFRFSSERIRSFVYKISLAEGLKGGEYAFIASSRMAGSATGATVVIYDFGVDGK